MLIRLSIKNFALIRELDIEFLQPFSVITGETGAGKSIILGALSLILGQRADIQAFSDITVKCTIEGAFDLSKCDLEPFFIENELDYEPVCIIRREITPQGKSRAFINDTPVNLNQIREITSHLVDVHSQHQTLLLQESAFQLSVVDSVADNAQLLQQYTLIFKKLNDLKNQRGELQIRHKKSEIELDYLNFVFDELDKAGLVAGEQELIESEANILTHAEEIKAKLYSAADVLIHREENLIKQLNELNLLLAAAAKYHDDISGLSERLNGVSLEIKDIAISVDHLAENTSFDPERLQKLNDRLNILYQLEQKHHVRSVEELIEIRNGIEHKINGIISLTEEIEEVNKAIGRTSEALRIAADELTQKRKDVLPGIENEVLSIITQLGMKDAGFKISMSPLDASGKNGKDKVTFLFSANKGVPLNDLSKVASGGELSRLMLSVKSIISSSSLLPTIIFDEIDSGVSGEISAKMGKVMQKLATYSQIIAISHVPQIAAKAKNHYVVFKEVIKGETYSNIKKLTHLEHISEIAKMISNEKITESSLSAAKQLING